MTVLNMTLSEIVHRTKTIVVWERLMAHEENRTRTSASLKITRQQLLNILRVDPLPDPLSKSLTLDLSNVKDHFLYELSPAEQKALTGAFLSPDRETEDGKVLFSGLVLKWMDAKRSGAGARDIFCGFARRALAPILQYKGRLLHSAPKTLAPGNFYILGQYPTDEEKRTLGAELTTLPSLDESHLKGRNEEADWQKPAENLTWLMDRLGSPLAKTCVSNLVFIESRKADSLGSKVLDLCWPVHERIIGIVKPKVILSMGNGRSSPFDFISGIHYREFGKRPKVDRMEDKTHKGFFLKSFSTTISGVKIRVIGLPNFSRYKIVGKDDLAEWITSQI
jgi:hypothetical protein